MIGIALLMPIDKRRAAGVCDYSLVRHCRLNRKVNDIRPMVGPWGGERGQRNDSQRCASSENELDSCRSFHNQEVVTVVVLVPLLMGLMPHRPFSLAGCEVHIAGFAIVLRCLESVNP